MRRKQNILSQIQRVAIYSWFENRPLMPGSRGQGPVTFARGAREGSAVDFDKIFDNVRQFFFYTVTVWRNQGAETAKITLKLPFLCRNPDIHPDVGNNHKIT